MMLSSNEPVQYLDGWPLKYMSIVSKPSIINFSDLLGTSALSMSYL